MTIEEQLAELSKNIEANQLENSEKFTKERNESLGYTMLGLALATLSLAIANVSLGSTIASGIASVILVLFGCVKLADAKHK